MSVLRSRSRSSAEPTSPPTCLNSVRPPRVDALELGQQVAVERLEEELPVALSGRERDAPAQVASDVHEHRRPEILELAQAEQLLGEVRRLGDAVGFALDQRLEDRRVRGGAPR